MLAYRPALLKVSSQKPQLVLMFGSEGFVTDGSTSAGPGFSRNVKGLLIENQMRAPAIWGMVTVLVEPGLPNAIAQF
jgi:hypothetical protein